MIALGRPALLLLLLLAQLAASLALLAPPAVAAPATRSPFRAIEALAPYQPQTTCSAVAKPGTLALRRMLLSTYPGTGSSGIVRDCRVGGRSEHKEGRGFDWRVSASNPRHRAQVGEFLRWLTATDRFGNRFAQARRLGVMYVIWDRRIWSSYAAGSGWRPYGGASPHTDHVHLSLSWAGALGATSYWDGTVAGVLGPSGRPQPVAAPAPAPRPGPTRAPGRGAPVLPADGLPQALAVGSGADGTWTPFALRAGQRVRLVASGTYAYGGDPMTADASCSVRPADRRWHARSQWDGRDRGHLELWSGGQRVPWQPLVDDGAGCDPLTHTYWADVTVPATGALHLRVDDDGHGDNRGDLVVRLLPPDTPLALPASGASLPRTVAVAAGARPTVTDVVLRAGQVVRLTARGTYVYGSGAMTADASCGVRPSSRRWHPRSEWEGDPGRGHLELHVGGRRAAWTPLGGAADGCDPDHAYTATWTAPADGPLVLHLDDDVHTDNSGGLTVEVS